MSPQGDELNPRTTTSMVMPEHDTVRQGSLSDEDSELADKERISSAVYYPHHSIDQQSLPDSHSIHRARSLSAVRNVLDEADHVVQPAHTISLPQRSDSKVRVIDRDIEISIQSDNESQHLHGDIPSSRRLSVDYDVAQYRTPSEGGRSASESDYEPSEDEETAAGAETPKAPSQFRTLEKTQLAPTAIELKPFSHQVGGHTALYRVSRRAICKKLNNRENKFYETVERYHPDLLDIMPR